MTIKQHGGVFGRNPSFNEVEVGDGAIKLYRDASNNAVIEEFAAGYLKLVGAGSIQLFSNNGEVLAKFISNGQSELYHNNLSRFRTTTTGVEVTDGDLKFADGHGIDFSATSGTGTSELFDDYEEGTWTPTITSTVGAFTTVSGTGFYTKIGRVVEFSMSITMTDAGTAAGSIVATLPFAATTVNAIAMGREMVSVGTSLQGTILSGGTDCKILQYNNATIIATGRTVVVTGAYIS